MLTRDSLIAFKRGYKRKSLEKLLPNEVNRGEVLAFLYVYIEAFLNNLKSHQNLNLAELYKFYAKQSEFVSNANALKKSLITFEKNSRYINENLSGKIDNFYSNDHFLQSNASLFQITLDYEALLASSSQYKKIRPGLRNIFLRLDVIIDFTLVLRRCLHDYLQPVNVTFEDKVDAQEYQLSETVDEISNLTNLMKVEVGYLLDTGKSLFEIYVHLEDTLVEAKWLISDYVKGPIGWQTEISIINENGFLFFANTYDNFPILHRWLTYEFVQTGDVLQSLLNVINVIEGLSTHVRGNLYRADLTTTQDSSSSFNSLSKFLHDFKVSNKFIKK